MSIAKIVGLTADGSQQTDINEEQLKLKLANYAADIIKQWSRITLEENRFLSIGEGADEQVYCAVLPEEMMFLVTSTLMLAPELIASILSEGLRAQVKAEEN